MRMFKGCIQVYKMDDRRCFREGVRGEAKVAIERSGSVLILAHSERGKWHRVEGPAVEYADGTRSWYENGKRHRLGGRPAIMCAHEVRYWYENGVRQYPR